MSLQIRMYLLIAVLFGILYGVFAGIGILIGIGGWLPYLILSFIVLGLQYLLAPVLVEHLMKVRWVTPQEAPELHKMVAELAEEAGIPNPRVGISERSIPNAFAFGRTQHDGRVCVTRGILNLLNRDEMRAVLGHEIGHIQHRDMMVITLLSAIPLILYWVAWGTMWSGALGGRRQGDNRGGYAVLIGLGAFVLYFITNLLVLYGSRIREYSADRESVKLGNMPRHLATALYKLSYGSARLRGHHELKEIEGANAFFLNDPARAWREVAEISQIDLNRSGTIDEEELRMLQVKKIRLSAADKMTELFTTHPNMLKRMKHLASLTT